MRKLWDVWAALFIAMLLMFLALSRIANAATTINFTWEANDPAEQITGYRLYMDCGGPECMVLDIPNPAATTCTYEVADKLNHAFSLTAYRIEADGMNESGHSDYAVYAAKKTPVPKPVKFKLITR